MIKPEWTIYFNSKCGSCRTALELIKAHHIKPKVVEYLKNPPSVSTLEKILKLGRLRVEDIIRTKEPMYEQLKLNEGVRSRKDLLRAISEHPILLERPIVVCERRAIVARPPEKVKELF